MRLECPNCRERVTFLRAFRTTAWTSFRCKACGSVLGISLARRMLAGLIWLLLIVFAGEMMGLYQFGRIWTYSIMGVSLVIIFYLCEKVTLIDRRAFTCKACGYDLTGLPENRCPECGHDFDPAERERILARINAPAPKQQQRWVAALLVVLLAGVVAGSLVAYYFASRTAALRAAALRNAAAAATQATTTQATTIQATQPAP